jgi:tetratricopeptide (TPR) repeat protein
MKFKLLLFSLFFVHTLLGQYAANENSLVFHSPFEASVLNAPFGNATEDQLKLYLATAPQNDQHAFDYIKLELKSVFANLEQQKFGKKSPARTVALLRDYLETKLLKKYDPYVSFEQLFKSGTYNDATRAAVVSLILTHFQIPFEMRHEGLFVSTIVKMEGKNLPVFDPMDPASELRFKSSYSQLLKDLKLLSRDEAEMDDEALFKKFYKDQDGTITPGQLAGNMYYNEALEAYRQKEYVASMNKLQKAQLLYPMPRNGVIRQACMFQLARRINFKSLAGLTDLFNLYNQYPVVEVKHELVSVFTKIADYHIIQKQDPDALHPFHEHFANKLKNDKELMASIDRVYYVKLARYYAIHNQRESLVKYIDLLHQRWPNEVAVQNVLAGFLMESLHRVVNYETGITQLNDFIAKYPFLEYKPEVQDRRLYFHSLRVRHFFENQQLENATKAMIVFEDHLSKYGRVDRVDMWLTTVYASASTYYFQEADYIKAREMANKALSLMPGNEYFAHRVEVLRQY